MSAAELLEQIRRRREELGLSHGEAAARAGMLRPAWSRAEAGRHPPALDTLERMAAAVGLRVVLEDDAAEAARELTALAQELGDYD